MVAPSPTGNNSETAQLALQTGRLLNTKTFGNLLAQSQYICKSYHKVCTTAEISCKDLSSSCFKILLPKPRRACQTPAHSFRYFQVAAPWAERTTPSRYTLILHPAPNKFLHSVPCLPALSTSPFIQFSQRSWDTS